MSGYDLPPELQVDAVGPVRVVRLNRPEQLNAKNHTLHNALARVWPQIDADGGARAAVLTGAGRAFSAGGDFAYLTELAGDSGLRKQTLADARQIVTGMIRCRVPIIAAVNVAAPSVADPATAAGAAATVAGTASSSISPRTSSTLTMSPSLCA